MARFGRGQPPKPIYLRNALVGAVVAATAAMPLRVVLAESHRPAPTHVIYLRPSRTSLVPDRLAPQLHIITASRRRPIDTGIIVQRTALAPVAPQQPHVIHVATAPRRHPTILLVRNPAAPVVVAVAPPAIHVVTARRGAQPATHVLVVRPSRTSLVPDRLAPQVHIVTARTIRRDGSIVQLRNPVIAAVVVAKAMPFDVVLAPSHRPAPTHVLLVRPSRTSLVPDRLAPQIHVVLQHHGVPRTHVFFTRIPREAFTVVSIPLFLRDESSPFFLVLDRSGSRYALVDQSTSRYADLDSPLERYTLTDQSQPRFLIQLGPHDASGTWDFTGETWDNTYWLWDGSWKP